MKRFIKVYNGVYAPVGHLDEDVHILSMKARNAASDDVLIRVQNFGGDVKPLKLSVDSTNGKGFLVDGLVSEVRGRSISANQPSNAVIKFALPDSRRVRDHSTVDIKEEHKDENQNTEEEGVFLSMPCKNWKRTKAAVEGDCKALKNLMRLLCHRTKSERTSSKWKLTGRQRTSSQVLCCMKLEKMLVVRRR